MVIEHIHKWKKSIHSAIVIHGKYIVVDFIWKGQSYMSKLKNDLSLLCIEKIAE